MSRRTVGWPAVVAAGLAGGFVTVAVLAVTGGLPTRTVEQPVVEKVAMTPVVSSPMVRGDRGVEAITARVGPAIARLDVERDGSTTSVSGVLFRDDGLILTSAHPVRGEATVTAVLADGRRFDAQVLGVDASTDIAVVHIEGEAFPVAVLGSTQGLSVGATTVAIGSPVGRDGAFVATGVVSATSSKLATVDGRWLHGMIQTDAPIAASCYGGALVDTGGAVIGIMTSLAGDGDDRFGFAIPIELAHRVAGQLAADGQAVHGWLGIAGADLIAAEADELGVPAGAMVREVAEGSPAAAAGLRPGDVITELDGSPVASMSALVVALRDHRPGHAVVVGYWRAGRHAETTAALSVKPSL